MSDAVLTDVTDGIGTLTLNRPAKLNAWDTPMRMEVKGVFDDWNGRDDVRAIIVTGAGDKAFSAGQDLDETAKFTSGSEGGDWFKTWRDFYNSIRGLDKPCVAALNGVAAGSAFQFSLLTDVRVGYPGTRMGQPEINSGIASVLGPMLMVPRLGLSRATELVLAGRMMDADEAAAAGLIHHMVDSVEQVMPKAREVAAHLASRPPIAMRLTKRWFREMTQDAFDLAFKNGLAIQEESYASGEPQEMMRAFFEKRAAQKKH